MGHDQLLEIQLLKKTGQHNFINWSTPFEQMSTGQIRLIFGNHMDSISFTFSQKISTARIANGQQRFWKMSIAQHNL